MIKFLCDNYNYVHHFLSFIILLLKSKVFFVHIHLIHYRQS